MTTVQQTLSGTAVFQKLAEIITRWISGDLRGADSATVFNAILREITGGNFEEARGLFDIAKPDLVGITGTIEGVSDVAGITTRQATPSSLPINSQPSSNQVQALPSQVGTGLAGTAPERLDRIFGQSATRGGRGDIFNAFAAAQGGNPLIRAARNLGFNPLSAAFALNQANDPSFGNLGGGDFIGPNLNSFRDFLGSTPQRLNTGQIRNALSGIASLFSGGQLSELDEARRDFISNAGENIASTFFGSQVNPLFRSNIQGAVGRTFDAARDLDPLGDPFAGFLTRQGF